MQQTRGLVVVVDDDDDIRLALSMLLSNEGYRVLEADGPKALASILAREKPGLVLLDMNFSRDTTSGAEGLDLLLQLIQQRVNAVLMTAWGSIELAVKGIQLGAADFIEKPWNNQKLLQLVDKHINAAVADKKSPPVNVEKKQVEPWIAQSDAMQQLEIMVQQVADTDASVLILGENGTGKSLLAHRLHSLSSRRNGPFISSNMGAIPNTLFESELFGHAKGAFTDAKDSRQGRFEAAQKGTLFLDEIGTLPSKVQPKMLRVLESGEYEPIGSSQTRVADVRVISATNADLESMVERGEFRRDLMFRLNTFILQLPPLRQRKQDILPLSLRLISKFEQKYKKSALKLSDNVIDTLVDYSWPGNIRELSHVIERAVILCQDSVIQQSHILLPKQEKAVLESGDNQALRPLDDIELEMITKALKKYQGHISKAAAALGISRNALYRRMEKYQLEKVDFDID